MFGASAGQYPQMTNEVKIANGTWTDESLSAWRRKELLQEDLKQLRARNTSKAAGKEAASRRGADPRGASPRDDPEPGEGDGAESGHPEAAACS
jgi:hypothetical protein